MVQDTRSIEWEAPEHRHIEKSGDWYWALGIIAVSLSVVSIIFNNVLFSIVIILGAVTMMLFGHRAPRMLTYEVSVRGVRVQNTLYPYDSFEQFSIDEDAPEGPQLILKSRHLFMPLLIIPIPDDCIDELDALLSERLPEVHMQEPLSHRLLEFFGF